MVKFAISKRTDVVCVYGVKCMKSRACKREAD